MTTLTTNDDPVTPPPAGHNRPPEEAPADQIERRAREYAAAGSAWANEIKDITTQQQADAAAAYVRQGSAIERDGDKARKDQKAPHDRAAKAVDAHWKSVLAPVGTSKVIVQQKLTAYLRAEDERVRREAEAARLAAEKAEREAALAADRAFEAMDKADRGELKGTGTNTVAAVEEAREKHDAAAEAKAEAERLAQRKAGAGGQYTVGGVRRSVTLRKISRLELDIPTNAPPKVIALALAKVLTWIATDGDKADLETAREGIMRAANAVYRTSKVAGPNCTVITEEKAV